MNRRGFLKACAAAMAATGLTGRLSHGSESVDLATVRPCAPPMPAALPPEAQRTTITASGPGGLVGDYTVMLTNAWGEEMAFTYHATGTETGEQIAAGLGALMASVGVPAAVRGATVDVLIF